MVPSARQQSGTASYPSPRRWQGCDPPAAARRRNRWNTEYAIETPVSRMVSTTSSGSTEPSVPRASSVVRSATERPLSYVVPAGRHLASRSSLQLCIPTLRHNAAAALSMSSRQSPRLQSSNLVFNSELPPHSQVYFDRQWGVSIHLHDRAMRLRSKRLQTPRSKIVGTGMYTGSQTKLSVPFDLATLPVPQAQLPWL